MQQKDNQEIADSDSASQKREMKVQIKKNDKQVWKWITLLWKTQLPNVYWTYENDGHCSSIVDAFSFLSL